jgi:hypothetical protein
MAWKPEGQKAIKPERFIAFKLPGLLACLCVAGKVTFANQMLHEEASNPHADRLVFGFHFSTSLCIA